MAARRPHRRARRPLLPARDPRLLGDDLPRPAGASEDHWRSLVQRLATELDADLFVVDRRCLHPWHPDGQALPVFLSEEWAPLSGQVSLAGKNFQWHRIRGRHVLTMDIPTHANALLVVLPNSEPHPDAVVLLHAATVLGLQLSRIVLSLEGRHRLAGEFLLQAMDGRLGAAEMESRLAAFEVSPQDFLLASLTADAADKAADDGGRLADVHIRLRRHRGASASLRRVGPTASISRPPESSGFSAVTMRSAAEKRNQS